ncbi:multidrug transporter AcrB [Rhodanobacter sp. FW510-R12]|uniref:efflux RND transporter permease subunit n=1 Tax=unclassified Rhodanobacter TaxID=2621553 RepID=UPI0007AA4F9A|nr:MULTISPECIES: efflux RND transporter permease subunit [unclassified Rhodanobacter]KZC15382.1 multidrug transporter AcrB [Rhodanobacter sp. FW104-R8]KZC25517.1 multidrug transporter AcrB [Rhodanobacter sp. FW510-T8]KZC30221.1 multidrug transporter AcrB [Rhodanobacter sp. FW510-R10]
MSGPRLGFSGRIARAFQDSPLTPILAIAALLLGLVAVMITPREEEPQIDVTMANVMVPFPGADVRDVENLVAFPLEQKLAEIEGVKHVYSVSRPGMAVMTVEFQVGVPRQAAIVRLYNQVFQNQGFVPPGLGVGPPLVRPMGIDDVPVMALTLWSDLPAQGPVQLAEVAHTLETELKRVPGTRDVYTIGAPARAVVVELDAAKLAAYGMTPGDLSNALKAANAVSQAGDRVGGERDVPVTAGRFLADAAEVSQLVIGLKNGQPVFLSDVATIRQGADLPDSYAWFGAPAGKAGPATGNAPAVTIAVAKKPGTNAADITGAIRRRLDALQGVAIPAGVHVAVTRDYGQTATDKADKLIHKLIFATLSVVLLVLLALSWRAAVVVGSAVIVTLALTLFASWAMGFTINRVSLFALIFSIGILVDDAIVVVENIHRHMALGGRTLREAIPEAVGEVGGPTILATFTVIAALLPMAFVSGLMGPYMRPIPINASAGMLLSLAVALVVTPWLALRLLGHGHPAGEAATAAAHESAGGWLPRLFQRVMTPFLHGDRAPRRRRRLFAVMGLLVLAAVGLVVVKAVVLKMLPFDNKSEFQVVVDMPEGSTLERTNRLLGELAQAVAEVPEVKDWQGYAGTAAPITFNGLVRQYYLRSGPIVGDLQVSLVDKHERQRQSHAIALAVRPALAKIGARYGASVKVVEVPPGPPVLAPIVAEVYGPDYATVRKVALGLERDFKANPDIVDVDTSVEAQAPRDVLVVDRARAARLGLDQAAIAQALRTALSGDDASYLMDGHAKYAVPIRLRLGAGDQAAMSQLLALRVRARGGALVPLSEVVAVQPAQREQAIWHKDLLPYATVTGDDAGATDSPLYGMFSLVGKLGHDKVAGQLLQQHFIAQPTDTTDASVKWDGEWQITYETFRDMGLAYSAGLLLIYLLVVGQFRSYVVPLIIMAPIPLTVIGVMPGHALVGAQYTATSMIGMIALAGIIVRNSILLIDFINHALAAGQPLREAVIDAAAVRAKPIVLTGVAAMIGGFFIIDDPIFQGLAVSLIFGILVSTALTLLVIPLLYYAWLQRRVGPDGRLSQAPAAVVPG